MRIAIIILLFASLSARAQKPFTRDYWLNESSTPDKVNAIAQDTIGYIWLGTDKGLIRYNGSDFVRIEDNRHKPITALCTVCNNVWIGYKDGSIGIASGQKIFPVHVINGPNTAITNIYKDPLSGLLFIAAESGVYMVMNNVAVKVTEQQGLSDDFTYCLSTYPGHVLTGSDKGINDITFANNKIAVQNITDKQGLPDNIVRVIKQIPETDKYWAGTQEGGIIIYDRNTKKVQKALQDSSWTWGQVNDILPISATCAWVATESGYLLKMTITDSGTIGIQPYYYSNKVFSKLLLDAAGNIWCGTNTGLTMMTGEYLYGIKLAAPYTLHDATALAMIGDTLLVALENKLYRVTNTDTTANLTEIFSAHTVITSLYYDKDNRLWIGTWGSGLFCREHNAITSVTNIPAMQNGCIIDITGTNDNLWVSGLNGVEQLSYPSGQAGIALVKHHDKKSGIGSDYVYELYPDRKGNIWMATDGAGVCMYDGNSYHHWNSFAQSNNKVAYSIAEDESGDMWAGMLYKDLYHFHNNKWGNLRRQETQYVDINISSVAANATGQVISVYQRCIDVWYPHSRYFRHFNSAMRVGLDSTSDVINCTATDKYGNVYLPYQHGILIFKDQDRTYDIKPRVHISRVNLNLNPVTGQHSFGHDENYLSFNFDGINYTNPERFNYRYILEGYNNEWVPTADASVTYPKLPPGKYTFRVQTSLNSSYDHAREDSYSFIIKTPFWKTWWFYIAVVFISFMLVYWYIKNREARLNKIAQLKQERMRFEYEHLKSQISPHFLFNSFNTLTSLIEENPENAVDYTTHLSDLYRYILAYPDRDLIVLYEECDILNNYIYIQKSRFGDALDVQMDIPEGVLQSKRIIPLALQLLVENAIKHNVVSTSQPLVISIIANETEIVVRNAIHPKISKEKKSGLGLVNIVKRYKLLTDRPITYGAENNDYVVKLPLL